MPCVHWLVLLICAWSFARQSATWWRNATFVRSYMEPLGAEMRGVTGEFHKTHFSTDYKI
jgi:hypothetical protein